MEGDSGSGWLRGLFTPPAPDASPPTLPEGSRIGKRFVVLRAVGTGGFGVVYAVRDRKLRRRVAIKLLDPRRLEGVTTPRSFLREARVVARLPHPHIVVVHDVKMASRITEPDGRVRDDLVPCPLMVMELLSGTPLRRDEDRGLPQTLALMDQLCSAVAYAHDAKVVHRDLKPSNILVQEGSVKVLDFGLAESLHRAHPSKSSAWAVGTPGYMAPEQVRGEAPDAACDVFALGVILFELLTGRLPFGRQSVTLPTGSPPRPRAWSRDVPEALDDLVVRCLAPDAQNRPANGAAVRAELARIRALVGSDGGPVVPADECPFPGLLPFDETKARYFFGRGQEVRMCLERLGRTALGHRRWLSLEGPSGAGKSSLVLGGLIPAIRKGWIADGPKRWRVAIFRPGGAVLQSMDTVLTGATLEDQSVGDIHPSSSPCSSSSVSSSSHASSSGASSRGSISAPIEMGPSPVDEITTEAVFREASEEGFLQVLEGLRHGEGLLLVVDQLEEMFTAGDLGAAEAARFDRMIGSQLVTESSSVYLVTTIRSDFLDALRNLPWLGRLLNSHASRYALPPLSGTALREAIAAPVALAGLGWSPELVDRIVADAGSQAGSLPLVAHLLFTLWQTHRASAIGLEAYEQHGGLVGALTQSADRRLETMGPEGKARARGLLLALVKTGRGAPDTRRTLSKPAALTAAGGGAEAEQVLSMLSGGTGDDAVRLVVVHFDDDESRVDLAHEALLRDWPTLRTWVVEARQALERRDDLEAAAQAWDSAGRPPGGLPRGFQLAYFQEASEVEGLAQTFLLAAESQARAEARRQIRLHRLRRILWATALMVVAGLAIWALYERRWVERQRAEALSIANELVRAVDEPLSALPGSKSARQPLLNATVDLLYTLRARDGSDRETRLNLVLAHGRRAQLALTTEGLPEALKEMGLAMPHYRAVEAEGIGHDGAVLYPVASQFSLLLYLSGRYQEALPWSETALKLAEQVREHSGRAPGTLDRVVDARANLASIVMLSGRLEEAMRVMAPVMTDTALREVGADGNAFARIMSMKGELALAKGRLFEARTAFHHMIAVQQDKLRAKPDIITRNRLAYSYLWLGHGELSLGEATRALPYLEESFAYFTALMKDDPERLSHSIGRMLPELRLAMAGMRMGRWSEAKVSFQKTIARLSTDLEVAVNQGLREHRVQAMRELGRGVLAEGDVVAAAVIQCAAHAEWLELYARDPGSTIWTLGLADSETQLGHVAYARGDFKEAIQWYQAARSRIKNILAQDPGRYEAQVADLEAELGEVEALEGFGGAWLKGAERRRVDARLERMNAARPMHESLQVWKRHGVQPRSLFR